MSTIKLQVVTPERMVLDEDVDIVITRGADGDLGILHGHEPLITPLAPGELTYRLDGEEQHLVVWGGFLEVRPDKVVVLADVAEHSEDIDRQAAEEARARAESVLSAQASSEVEAHAAAELQQALLRLRVAGRRRHRERSGPGTEG